MEKRKNLETEYDYDICLSFAGEDRDYVETFAGELLSRGIRVFYDNYEQVDLWGKDLYSHLDYIYQNTARYCVLFISEYYAKKVWTNHERQSAQARALRENKEYILPARFDNSEVLGLRETVGYIDLRTTSPSQLAILVEKKLGVGKRHNYLPPEPDKLYENLGISDKESKEIVWDQADDFLEALKRTTEEERRMIFLLFLHGCPAELPDNIHIDVDLLKRLTGFPFSKLKSILGGMRSIGFFCSIADVRDEHEEHLGATKLFVLEWHSMRVEIGGKSTLLASEMINGGARGYCDVHAMEALLRLDFSQLSSVTTTEDIHEEA